MANDKDYVQKISAEPSSFVAGWQKAASAARNGSDDIQRAAKGLNSSFDLMRASLVSLGTLATGGLFAAVVKSSANLQDELSKSAQKAGVMTEAFSASAYAAKLADLSNEDLTKAYVKLGVALTNAQQGQKEQAELFKRLKLDPQNIKDADQLLLELAQRFASMEDGAKKTSLAVDVFGEKLGPRLIPFLNAGKDGLEALRKEAADLGIVVSTQAGRDAEKFNDSLTTMGTAVRGASMQIGNVLIPELTKAATFFTDVAKESGVWEATLASIGRIISKGFGIDETGQAETKLRNLKLMALQARQNLSEMSREKGATAAGVADILRTKIKGLDAEILKASADLAQLNSGAKNAGGGRGFVNPPNARRDVFDPDAKAPTKAETAPSRMGGWEAELADLKVGIQRKGLAEDQYREMTKSAEAKFWQDRLALTNLSQQEKEALSRKAAEAEMAGIKQNFEVKVATLQAEAAEFKSNTEERLRLERMIQAKYQEGTKEYEQSAKRIVEIQRQAAEQQAVIRDTQVQVARDARLSMVELEAQSVQTSAQLGAISQAQMLDAQEQFENRRNDILRDALIERQNMAVLAKDRDPVQEAKIDSELEALAEAHQLRLGAIRGAQAVEQGKYQDQFFQGMQGNLQTSIANVLTGTQKLSSAFKSTFASIGQTLSQVVAKMAADWLVGQIKKRLASKETALTELNNAAVAAAGNAYNAVVGIYMVGPFLAPIAAAAAYAGVMAFGASASAEGGFDIPGNVNPIVQTHAKEMILPAKHADVIRAMADNNGAAGGGALSQGAPIVLRERSSSEFFIANRSELVAALKSARRDFAF